MKQFKTGSTPKIKYVHLISLGCPKNLVDTGIAAGVLAMDGYALTDDISIADIIWINTCAFLEDARNEAAEVIEEALQYSRGKHAAKIVVAGCLVRWDALNGFAFRSKYPKVAAWIGIDDIEHTAETVKNLFKKGATSSVPCEACNSAIWLQTADTPRLLVEAPHFAYLRISDGCDNCCSYCLIPSIRGHLRSRKLEDVLKEANNLIKMGIHELIVIAQDTGGFGRDFGNGGMLPDLLDGFDRMDGDFLVRLMYLHPRSITDRLLNSMNNCKHLIRHIEMPIQHVTDNMLTRMNRHISAARQNEVIHSLRSVGFTMRTTLMTGFPGETEEDFAALETVVREKLFSRIGVFSYSREPGTPAYDMTPAVPAGIGASRRDKLMELQRGISLANNNALIGKTVPVIADAVDGRIAVGRLFEDIPDIDNTVNVSNVLQTVHEGDIMNVTITRTEEYDLYGNFSDYHKKY